MLHELNTLVDVHANLRKTIIEKYKSFVSDTNVSLNDRWIAHKLVNDILPCESYSDGFIEEIEPGLCMYDDFYVERHETMSYIDMWDRIQEKDFPEENMNAWREAILKSGYGSFTFDW